MPDDIHLRVLRQGEIRRRTRLGAARLQHTQVHRGNNEIQREKPFFRQIQTSAEIHHVRFHPVEHPHPFDRRRKDIHVSKMPQMGASGGARP